MSLGWTVIYSTLERGMDSFTMMAGHDGVRAWDSASDKLVARFGPDENITVHAIVKGMNPSFIKKRDS